MPIDSMRAHRLSALADHLVPQLHHAATSGHGGRLGRSYLTLSQA